MTTLRCQLAYLNRVRSKATVNVGSMTTGNARYARLPVLNIHKIVFSLYSRDELAKLVVCNVIHKELNTAQRSGDAGTLYDRMMGPIGDLEKCKKCLQTLANCPGHFGRIKFALPMPHPEYGKDYAYLLGAFCNCLVPDEDDPGQERLCLAPLVTMETIERYANVPQAKKWRRLAAAPSKSCAAYTSHRSQDQATVIYYTDKDPRAGSDPFRMILRHKDRADVLLNPARLQKWVAQHVHAYALEDLGLGGLAKNGAEQLVMDSLLVIPNTMRTPTTGEGTQGTIHNDLTQIYSKIVGANNALRDKIAELGEEFRGLEAWDRRMDGFFMDKALSGLYVTLCSLVLRFFNNKDNACREMHATKAPKGVTEMLDGKDGLIRQEVFAGRSGNSARTVVVANANIDVDEVGIPGEIMDKLVQPVTVTEYNKEEIKRLAKEGKIRAIKGGPDRERRGDKRIDVESYLSVPENVIKLRALIYEFTEENGEPPGNTYLRDALEVTQEELDSLLDTNQALSEQEEARIEKINGYIDSIAPGDIVDRVMQDGDILTISRQPILRKYSMMAHRAKRVEGKAMQVADGSNQPYNLDHDGDEMNIHVPQGVHGQAEALKLMYFGRNMLSEQSNRPIVGLIQDALLSAYLMTSTVTVVTEIIEKIVVGGIETTRPRTQKREVDVEENMNLRVWQDCVAAAGRLDSVPNLLERCKRVGVNPYSGRGLFSVLFREDFVYSGRGPENTGPVLVRAGVLVKGTLSQATLNTAQNSIHHELVLRYGPDEAVRFLSDARRLCHRWLESYGYTLGYKDVAQTEAATTDIERMKQDLIEEVKRTARLGKNAKGSLAAHVEADVLRGSNNILDRLSGVVMQHVNPNNSFLAQVTSGSKGSKTSIAQVQGMVGQITIQQDRPKLTLSDRTRIDLHFPEDDTNPEARGLCSTSYVRGLRPSAMIFQGMATHQAAYDISIHTGDTGYTQRKLVMFLIHLSSQINGAVTSADGSIVEYRYGGDGLAANRVLNIGGKARYINVDSVIDAVKLEVLLAGMKGVKLPPATRYFLTPFEEVNIIAQRAIALQAGAKPYLQPSKDMPLSAVLQANAEYEEGLLTDITVPRRSATGQNTEVVLEHAIGIDTTVKNGL